MASSALINIWSKQLHVRGSHNLSHVSDPRDRETSQGKPPDATQPFPGDDRSSVGAASNISVASRLISRIFRKNTASAPIPYAALVIASSPRQQNKRSASNVCDCDGSVYRRPLTCSSHLQSPFRAELPASPIDALAPHNRLGGRKTKIKSLFIALSVVK